MAFGGAKLTAQLLLVACLSVSLGSAQTGSKWSGHYVYESNVKMAGLD